MRAFRGGIMRQAAATSTGTYRNYWISAAACGRVRRSFYRRPVLESFTWNALFSADMSIPITLVPSIVPSTGEKA